MEAVDLTISQCHSHWIELVITNEVLTTLNTEAHTIWIMLRYLVKNDGNWQYPRIPILHLRILLGTDYIAPSYKPISLYGRKVLVSGVWVSNRLMCPEGNLWASQKTDKPISLILYSNVTVEPQGGRSVLPDNDQVGVVLEVLISGPLA